MRRPRLKSSSLAKPPRSPVAASASQMPQMWIVSCKLGINMIDLLTLGTRREMTYIYESWLASGEKWTKCSVYLNVTSNLGTRRRGVKKWLTFAEISKQYGERVATAIVEHKLASPELAEEEVRWHPDCPGNEASRFCLHYFQQTCSP